MCKNKQKYQESNIFFLLLHVMKRIIYIFAAVLLVACSEGNIKKAETESATTLDTIPMLVTQMQKVSRLYTAEYHIHKIITHNDQLKIEGSFLTQDFSIDLPVGERRIAIPMDATVKTYVDMGAITKKNIKRQGNKITVTLPDPKIQLTSTKINHEDIKKYVALTRSSFSDAELASYEKQGRQAIINNLPKMGIPETARRSAANALIPLLTSMGFHEENITITFRKEFSAPDITKLISTPNTEDRQ